MEVKKCATCLIEKDLSLFCKKNSGKFGVNSRCRKCVSDYKKLPRVKLLASEAGKRRPKTSATKTNARERSRAYRLTEKGQDSLLKSNIGKYGITLEDYNEMFLAQDGKCLICEKHQIEINRRLAVDHCHDTKKVRGLLCSPCNAALGGFGDNVLLLNKAIKYLNERSL